jgi:hypothetical protein
MYAGATADALAKTGYSGIVKRILAEEMVGAEWAEWYALSPAERFRESEKLWETYLALGGSLEPEPDTQSPFFDPEEWRENAAYGPGVRVLRRGGV